MNPNQADSIAETLRAVCMTVRVVLQTLDRDDDGRERLLSLYDKPLPPQPE